MQLINILTVIWYILFMSFIIWTRIPISLLENKKIQIVVESGNSVKFIVNSINQNDFHFNERNFIWMTYLYNNDQKFKAGDYEISTNDTPYSLMNKFIKGDCNHRNRILFIEGWNFIQFRQALKKNIHIKQTIDNVSDYELMRMLDSVILTPEGLFYPDTYYISHGITDFEVLKIAHNKFNEILSEAWNNRSKDIAIKTPYEAMIVASIIEKESSNEEDRFTISGVINNRLKIGMRLQSDPTIIYGMGKLFKGKIKNSDLKKDNPWNTYTRSGLPATPICSFSKSSLYAALNPYKHDYIYYVARGDGSTSFSKTLESHNNKVKEFSLKKGKM
ncbi:endolytic transglycosylase MltG [Candidatus Kinetoplastidibacterium desouzai]|nr:endolytic transglycosylase MltG [Candidatus Kinetoplastibacterium desouzaii]